MAADTLAIDDLFGPRNVVIVEWGEKFARFCRERDVEIAIECAGDKQRLVRVSQ